MPASQVVEVLHDAGMKQKWLLDRLQRFIDDGDVLVFANQKVSLRVAERMQLPVRLAVRALGSAVWLAEAAPGGSGLDIVGA